MIIPATVLKKLWVCLHERKKLHALTARLPYAAPGWSRFLGRPEHTCGTRAQQEDSVGFEPTTSQHLHVLRYRLYHWAISYSLQSVSIVIVYAPMRNESVVLNFTTIMNLSVKLESHSFSVSIWSVHIYVLEVDKDAWSYIISQLENIFIINNKS